MCSRQRYLYLIYTLCVCWAITLLLTRQPNLIPWHIAKLRIDTYVFKLNAPHLALPIFASADLNYNSKMLVCLSFMFLVFLKRGLTSPSNVCYLAVCLEFIKWGAGGGIEV